MASPAKPSSSSSIAFKTNPNMRKSELNDPMRKSFSGNPFTKPSISTNRRSFNPTTPANSPSDFPRRHSTSRESLAYDKENSKDANLKPARIKSPALSKGIKHFMSPTISAASKINASPRKQILVDRNETVRSSISFSDVEGLFPEDKEPTPDIALKQKRLSLSDVKSIITEKATESTSEIGFKHKKVSFSDVESIINEDTQSAPEISLNQKVSFADNNSNSMNFTHDSQSSHHEFEGPLKINTDFDYKESENDSNLVPETVTEEKDSVNVDPSFKISPREKISPSCPVLASLDSDPLMLPYDPKTNYLSPRPQFRYYMPNPRIEVYQEREGKQLDELFASESYSDTDVSVETTSDIDVSEDITAEEIMEEGEEEELHVVEPNQSFKAETMSKPHFTTRSKFITLLLFLGFAYFSVLVVKSPALTPGLGEISLPNFQVPPEVTEFAKANFDRFTQNLEHWSACFLYYVSNIISSSREVHKLGPFRYANLSLLMEDHMIEGQFMFDSSPMEPIWEKDAETEQFDDKHYREIETYEGVDEDDDDEEPKDQENEASETLEVSEQPDEVQQVTEVEMIEDNLEEEESKGVEFSVQLETEHNSKVDIKDQQGVISPQPTEIQHDISKTGDPIWEKDAETEQFDDKHYREIETYEGVDEDDDDEEPKDQENEASETLEVSEQPDEVQQVTEVEMIEDNLEEEESKGVEFSVQLETEHNSKVDIKDQQSVISPQPTEIQHDMSKTGDPEGDGLNVAESLFPEEVKSENLKIEDHAENSQISEVADITISGREQQFFTKNNVMGLSVLVLCLLAASPFICIKRGSPSKPNASVPAEQPLSKKSEYSPVSVSSENWETEVDVAESCPSETKNSRKQKTSSYYSNKRVKESNEPCPSEMSSSDGTSSSYSNKGLKETNQYQSQETKTRKSHSRQSLASSITQWVHLLTAVLLRSTRYLASMVEGGRRDSYSS